MMNLKLLTDDMYWNVDHVRSNRILHQELVHSTVFLLRIVDDKCGVMWMSLNLHLSARSFNNLSVY